MKLYKIYTHFSNSIATVDEPWSAFIFEPQHKKQTPMQYLQDNFIELEDTGNLTTGTTEVHAVYKLFSEQTRRKAKTDNSLIFEKNNKF